MIKKTVTVINKLGLHARAATKFVNLAKHFRSRIEIVHEQRTVDGKSIMSVMTLGATKDTSLTLIIDGIDEQDAWAQLYQLFQNRFGEME